MRPTTDPLERFVVAQNLVFGQALGELRAGRKKTHWIWFVFPQISGLGLSAMSKRFAIMSLAEARAYLSRETLGSRLKDATRAVLTHIGPNGAPLFSVGEIFGWPDRLKFHSSMTLFDQAAPNESLFKEALNAYFDGQQDHRTIDRLLALSNEKERRA